MTLGKKNSFFLFCFIFVCCSESENDKMSVSNITFAHRPSESIIALANDYTPYTIDTICADLHVFVMSALKEQSGYNWPEYYYTNGDKDIEQQIDKYLAPELRDYWGELSLIVEYRTEVCNSIRLTLYNSDGVCLSDITEKAQFYANAPYDWSEKVQNLLVNSKKKLLGKIKLGTTISEYLSYHPMVFAEAHFIFPDLKKETFDNGNYVKVEIELANNTILTGVTNASK